MTRAGKFFAFSLFAILAAGIPMPGQTPRYAKKDSKPVESEHIKGPQGLDSWTLDWPLMDSKNDEERYPFTLVIARNGRVIRRNQGSPFIWKWMFWDHGRQVAYEAGPLHFSMACVLVDTDTGRQLAEFDCEYVDLPKDAPEWLKALVR